MSSKDKSLSKQFKALDINPKSDIHILLLGEKSIGKSTFINALANCTIFDKLKDAKGDSVRVVLPSRLSIKDKSSACHLISVGVEINSNVNNEDAFSTKQIKTYAIPLKVNSSSKLYVIDTPGFDGGNEFEQNKKLCDDILSYIAPLQEIHAICWFLSPTDRNISLFFDYCVNIILPRIDKKSFDNIAFCFSKTLDFTSGETWFALEKAIVDFNVKSASKIKINRQDDSNMFSFENDFFRYLMGIKHKYEMNASIYTSSWEHTSREMKKLIEYVSKRPKTVTLKNTPSINEGRRLIMSISQPLFDILQLIQDNLNVLNKQVKALMSDSVSLADLKKKLYVPIVSFSSFSGNPFLVCSNSKCLQFSMDWGINRWEFKDKCHENCFLSRPSIDLIGGPELTECEKIDSVSHICMKCGCDVSMHMHIYYTLKWTIDTKFHSTTELNTTSEILHGLEKVKNDINHLISVYEQERQEIIIKLAEFAHFLEKTSNIPYRSSYDDYLQYLVKRSEAVLLTPEPETTKQLTDMLTQYRTRKSNDLQSNITGQKIMDSIVQLYNLDSTGCKIKELMKRQRTARQKEHDESIVDLFSGEDCKSTKQYKDKNKSKKTKKESSSSDDSDSDGDSEGPDKSKEARSKKQRSKDKKDSDDNKNGKKYKEKSNKKSAKKDKKKGDSGEPERPINSETTSRSAGASKTSYKSGTFPKNINVNNNSSDHPPPYDTVVSGPKQHPPMYPNLSHSNLPHQNLFHSNLPHQNLPHLDVRHGNSSQTIEVKVFNSPNSPAGESHLAPGGQHPLTHPGLPHHNQQAPGFSHGSQSVPPHQNHGSFNHGPPPYGGGSLHGPPAPLPGYHSQQPHVPGIHGQQPHGSGFHGQQPYGPVFHGQPPSESGYHGHPQPYGSLAHGHQGAFVHGHSPHGPIPQHGVPGYSSGLNDQKPIHGFGKGKIVSKAEKKKFKPNSKKKGKKDKGKQDEKKKKDKSDSSSSSDSD